MLKYWLFTELSKFFTGIYGNIKDFRLVKNENPFNDGSNHTDINLCLIFT